MITETAHQVLREMRAKIDQPETDPGDPFWDDAEQNANLNREWEHLWEEIQEQDSGFFLPTTTIAMVSGQYEYDLPLGQGFVKEAWYRVAGGSQEDRTELRHVPHAELSMRQGYTILSPGQYDGAGGSLTPASKLVVSHGLAVAGQEVELFYGAAPYRISAGTCPSVNAADTKMNLESWEPSIDNVFAGARWYIAEGTGAGQVRDATGYDGALKELTVSGAWTTPPDATSVYTALIPLPSSAIRALIYGAALRCLANEETPKFQSVAALYKDAVAKMQYRVRTMNRKEPKQTRDEAGYLDFARVDSPWSA